MGKQDPSITLEAARAAWLADARFRRLSPVTIREYGRVSGALLRYLAAELGRTPRLDDLRPAVIRAWLNDRRPALQPASVAAYVRSLRAFARWCGREYKTSDPLAGLRPPRVDPTPVPIFTPDQLRVLLDAAPLHLAYAITLLAESGLRVSEAVAVDLDHIDAEWIQVRRGKGGRARKVPVSALLARATDTYLGSVRPRMAHGTTRRLLVAGHGRPWTPDSLRLALRRLGLRAGIRASTAETSRRACSSPTISSHATPRPRYRALSSSRLIAVLLAMCTPSASLHGTSSLGATARSWRL